MHYLLRRYLNFEVHVFTTVIVSLAYLFYSVVCKMQNSQHLNLARARAILHQH